MAAARDSDCPCTSKGVKRRASSFVHRQEPPAWATHKRDALLGQAQNGARAGGADFTVVTFRAWGSCVGRFPHACVTSQLMGKEAARTYPVKMNNRGRAAHLPFVLSPIS